MRVLVCAAHPDDEWLGIGGTITRHIEVGDQVTVYIAFTAFDPRGGDLERADAALGLAEEVGYGIVLGGLAKVAGAACRSEVEDIVSAIHPEVVYGPWRSDINEDHRRLAEAVEVACRPYASSVRALRLYDTPSATEWGVGFAPNLFVAVDAERKAERFLRAYPMEARPVPHPRSRQGLVSRARYWGQVAGLEEAEAFSVVRETWR